MNPVTWTIIALLIAVNALYVAAEFAAVGTRRSRIRMLAQDGDARAVWVLPIVEDPARLDRYVAACQIGITFSSLVLGAFGQATLARDLAPALESLGGWSELAAQGVAAFLVLLAPDDLAGHPRRAPAEVPGAAVPDARAGPHRRADARLPAAVRAVHLAPQRERHPAAQAAPRPAGLAPSHPLTGRDRPAHRREP